MPSVYGRLLAAAREAAVWVDALYTDAKVEYSRYYKEVYVLLGRRGDEWREVLVFKLVERRWYLTPAQLRRVAAGMLRRAKSVARRATLVILAWRVTGGALRLLSSRLRWVRVYPLSALRPSMVKQWLARIVLEAYGGGRLRRAVEALAARMAERLAADKHVARYAYALLLPRRRRLSRLLGPPPPGARGA